ncbi:MAG: hypothetical protein DRQ48_11175 [Gammaproteobacteria bacterium]|nr:MAG: hypothetical protein DRQ48_11175 [Gammaproteobacteria bacterium]
MQKYGVRNYVLSSDFAQRFDNGEFNNIQTKNGYFTLLGKQYYYRSSYELKVFSQLKLLESDIQTFQTNYVIPYEFNGIFFNYLADFFITATNQKTFIIETKNDYLLSQKKTQAKIAAAKKLCIKQNWEFILLCNNDIECLDIKKLLDIE